MVERPLFVVPNAVIAELTPYVISRPGVDPDLILDFNESLAPPAALADSSTPVNRYPDKGPLEAAISRRLGIGAESVLVTCGADDALERTIRVVTGPGRKAVLTTPTYGMIRRFALTNGAEVDEVEWWVGDFPVAEVCRRAEDSAGLVAVVSPSNPTGTAVTKAAFQELVDRLPGVLILLDQAYVDFTSPEFDLTEIALASPNVVIIRTFSKAWGGAGLRVGCAIGDPRVIDWLRRVGQPFPASALSVEAAMKVVAEGPDQERISRVREQRDKLVSLLTPLAEKVLPSEASFVFARFSDADRVWRGLGSLGIAVRQFPGRPGVGGWLRITMPGEEDAWKRLERGLRTIIQPEALLFDLDGVLADVSRSYRRTIIETAASWGVEITPGDIADAKAAGDANNDWRLTRELLNGKGVEAGLEEVTDRFEEIYQGSETEPGLRRFETLRLAPSILEALARRLPLGIVTGRPRADADRFLEDHDIVGFFQTVVCMEDAQAKPDPAPIRLALQRLGADTAWMVGDTPDDLRAARGAGVLPVGIAAPGDDPAGVVQTLEAAGVAFILDELQDLERELS